MADAAAARARFTAAGVPVEDREDGSFLVRDPWAIALRVAVAP